MRFIKKGIVVYVFLILCSFTLQGSDKSGYEIIRFEKRLNGNVISKYKEGIIYRQISKNNMSKYILQNKDIEEIKNQTSQLDFNIIVQKIDEQESLNRSIKPNILYLFIKNNDTIKTRMFEIKNIPQELRRLDYLMTKKRN